MPAGKHWKLRGIPPNMEERMKVRHPLPEAWAGLLDAELKAASGIRAPSSATKGALSRCGKQRDDAFKALRKVNRHDHHIRKNHQETDPLRHRLRKRADHRHQRPLPERARPPPHHAEERVCETAGCSKTRAAHHRRDCLGSARSCRRVWRCRQLPAPDQQRRRGGPVDLPPPLPPDRRKNPRTHGIKCGCFVPSLSRLPTIAPTVRDYLLLKDYTSAEKVCIEGLTQTSQRHPPH